MGRHKLDRQTDKGQSRCRVAKKNASAQAVIGKHLTFTILLYFTVSLLLPIAHFFSFFLSFFKLQNRFLIKTLLGQNAHRFFVFTEDYIKYFLEGI